MRIQLGTVDTWYDELGQGAPVLLLHPGGADSRAWEPNLKAFAARFRVFTPDRRGHGRTPDADGPIGYDAMADDMAAFLREVVGGPAHVVGCSDGATVALRLAALHPGLVRRLVLVAGVFHHDGWLPGAIDLDEESAAMLGGMHDEVSPDGPGHFPVVAAKLERMHRAEPSMTEADLTEITARTLVMVGDDDQVRLEHALALYRSLGEAELAVVPGASHGLLVEKPALCEAMIGDFLELEPVPTLAPIHRASTRP